MMSDDVDAVRAAPTAAAAELHAELARVTAERDALHEDLKRVCASLRSEEIRAATAERKQADMAEELTSTMAILGIAIRSLATVATPTEGVWKWQGEGDDPESLSCPVVMSADTLRGLVAGSAPPSGKP